MKKIILKLYCLLVFAVPLIFLDFPEDHYEMNKITLIYFLTGVTLITWLGKAWQERKIHIINNGLFPLILGFLFFNLISLAFSIHPYSSLIGNSYRFNGGIISLIDYIALFFIFIETFHGDKKALSNIVSSILLSSVFVSLYGIYQIFQLYPSDSRIFSTLGQPNYLGEYLALVLPLNFYYIIKEKIQIRRFGFLILFAVNFIVLLVTGSRSSWFAFAIAMMIFAIILGKNFVKLNKKFLLTIVVLMVLLLLSFFNQIRSRINPYLFTEIKNENILQGGLSLRTFAWRGAIQIFTHNPLFGTGPETMMFAMPRYIDKGINSHIEWDQRFDKAHNEFLDILANTGFFAFLFYILILISALKISIFNRKNSLEQKILGIPLIAMTVANLFSFSSVTIALYFWIILALIIASQNSQSKILNVPRRASIFPTIILLFLVFSFYYFWGKVYLGSFYFSRFLPEKAVIMNPNIDRYHGTLAIKYLNSGNNSEAIREANAAVLVNPLNPDNYIIMAETYENISPKMSLSSYGRAIELDPTNPKNYLKQAKYFIKIDQKSNAKESLKKALELKPDYPEAKNLLNSLKMLYND